MKFPLKYELRMKSVMLRTSTSTECLFDYHNLMRYHSQSIKTQRRKPQREENPPSNQNTTRDIQSKKSVFVEYFYASCSFYCLFLLRRKTNLFKSMYVFIYKSSWQNILQFYSSRMRATRRTIQRDRNNVDDVIDMPPSLHIQISAICMLYGRWNWAYPS